MAHDVSVRRDCYPQYGYMTPFEATEELARQLQQGVAWFATNEGIKSPTKATYSPLYATPTMGFDVWRLRQVLDELGVSYWFFVQHAMQFWAQKKVARKRVPRPMQLCTPTVIDFVMTRWTDPQFRFATPIFDDWDQRFKVERYVGDLVQTAARKLIDQRLDDAIALGYNPAHALAPFVGKVLTKAEAIHRYGESLVEEAAAYTPADEVGDLGPV
ncbi:hypothetical protein LF41_1304 [Lysobacter dokdonensis DS-58]|uniref:Uncharacterized protein n=2 Tax=Noviluteimonas TaxID=3382693 RepID=A0A0A2X6B0_9GAMM|nr:hypothetical protein LF41_1304 [Lysobacter dokdonensis DS-58]